MVFVYGTDLYGKVDNVPGIFSVRTRFGHLYYVPLVPVGSYIVLKQQGKQFTGISIPLQFKSIVMAYAIGALVPVWAFAALCTWIVMDANRNDSNPWIPGTICGIAFALWLVAMGISLFSKASYKRACQLGVIANLTDAGWEKLNAKYGRTGTLPQP